LPTSNEESEATQWWGKSMEPRRNMDGRSA
jgi:hypothetical protein